MIDLLGWLGFAFTIAGSFMLAFDRWQGWLAFIIANAVWGFVALGTGQIPLLAQMVALMIPAIVGVRNSAKRKAG